MAVKMISTLLLFALVTGSLSAKPSIADWLITNPRYTTLLGAANASGLIPTLQDKTFEGTVFLPRNTAFNKVAKEFNVSIATLFSTPALIKAVLLGHVIGGAAIASKDIKLGRTIVPTLGGYNITVIKTKQGVSIVDSAGRISHVIKADVKAGKSIIHEIDNVLLPADIVSLARPSSPSAAGSSPAASPSPSAASVPPVIAALLAQGNLNTLASILSVVYPASFLSSLKDVTILTPTDKAFEPVVKATQSMGISLAGELAPTIKALLTGVLETHVIPGSHPAASLTDGAVLDTLSGAKLTVDLKSTPGTVKFVVTTVPSSVGPVAKADIKGPNGILIHEIDGVLSNVDLSGFFGRR